MWKKLYSNSGLILLAVLCAGVWFRNLRSFYPPKSNDFAYSDELLASSPAPTSSLEERLEQGWLKLTSEDVLRRVRANATAVRRDGSSSHATNRRGACDKLFRWGAATRGQLTPEQRERLNGTSLDEVIAALT